ncbi:hypothetical protein AUEXF2481DRAFT_538650 [Aureobasidium subglaciale EXF-2481]|uniref:Uncharacterized protein n=1 Tax=Aureobasidium subglaciale (strain EXF-2481) TaxID=1043005 RepID=A0A074YNH6_AURSE|nr:uncharacterized protein AUEXF2481DRAFT_538650 [Aureobasidium subglaciale EXF-2481]KEQ97639.1 hypothetical protein AUEXF2481DRAFT_538650 [Aureobasidium subglaciale EXF-2481]
MCYSALDHSPSLSAALCILTFQTHDFSTGSSTAMVADVEIKLDFINWRSIARVEWTGTVCREGPAYSTAERRLALARSLPPANVPYSLIYLWGCNGRSGNVEPDMHEIQQGTLATCISLLVSTGDFSLHDNVDFPLSACNWVPTEHRDLQAAGRSVRQDLLVWN